MFKVVKLKNIVVCFVLLIVFLSVGIISSVKFGSAPKAEYVIVVDAGHGGIDGGCEGTKEGSNERELNLKYAKCLKNLLESYGFNVVMTRSTTDGLYSAFAENKKKDDMKKRKEIIEKSNANLVVSLHMNAFPQKSARGAQVYYNSENEASLSLANSIQETFKQNLPYAKNSANVGDYFLLNCTSVPSVIVECGFLSNLEEEGLLLSDEYCQKVCYSIFCGVVKFIN